VLISREFMPATAAERSLLDAFDPAQALPNRPSFCAMRGQFGNLGLAAAAHNAGSPARAELASGKTHAANQRRSPTFAA
jgi:hypothetical protein